MLPCGPSRDSLCVRFALAVKPPYVCPSSFLLGRPRHNLKEVGFSQLPLSSSGFTAEMYYDLPSLSIFNNPTSTLGLPFLNMPVRNNVGLLESKFSGFQRDV